MKEEKENNSKGEDPQMTGSAEFQVRSAKEQNLTSASSVESTGGSSRRLFCKQNAYQMQQINVKRKIGDKKLIFLNLFRNRMDGLPYRISYDPLRYPASLHRIQDTDI